LSVAQSIPQKSDLTVLLSTVLVSLRVRYLPNSGGISLQRLFSNFANGWPGRGLLAQRVLIAALLAYCVVNRLREASASVSVPELIGAGLSIFILLGLWTPIVGTLVSLIEVWVFLSRGMDVWIPIILATLSATLAMIGPGAWSVDARLFGRKHIEPPEL
jgi:putative oxidoreductase